LIRRLLIVVVAVLAFIGALAVAVAAGVAYATRASEEANE
jgi:hypothetical protein